MGDYSEREAFHAAVWQSPDDDLPRLVYADWLDERGEPDAAAFLRLLSAVRTCPPDVDQLRPLVAALRRTMVKVPAKWVEDVCPIPPAVVVGPWVDVDHEANREVLAVIRKRRRERTGLQPAGETIHVRPRQEVRGWPSQAVVDWLWGELQEALSPAAACAIDGVPALVDVWSGVVMAVAVGEDGYAVRRLSDSGRRPRLARELGEEWAYGSSEAHERGWLRRAAHQFDPANDPA